MDSQNGLNMFDYLHKLLFEVLLTTDGRTTDMLETLMDEKMTVQVIRQHRVDEAQEAALGDVSGGPFYLRESILVSDKSHFVVSHNIALVCANYVPPPLFEALANKREGIGKTINVLGLQTSRKLTDFGWRTEAEAVDLFRQPLKLRFERMSDRAPYKKYSIFFGANAGIHLLEYFNPDIVRHRLKRVSGEQAEDSGQ